uniref:Uncharacterized protein n=1 Tax=virus sp. ctJpG3 TaxID=2825812 RepID=A0A8S5RMP7_9VIRU|nr:MAG TPA: hypothetical protein [virus sp. ctJpG3]DAH62770.1 MAG TPA: hypothetical protein [Bacteriophage sp.]DAN22162.1 MAG TPA_asm: hypothetical protein [Bacteriophage sp.]
MRLTAARSTSIRITTSAIAIRTTVCVSLIYNR